MVSQAVSFRDLAPKLNEVSPEALRPHFHSLNEDLLSRVEGHAAAIPVGPARAHLFASLAVASRRGGDGAKAAKLVNRALNNSEKIEDPCERVESLCAVSTVLDAGGLTDGANEALQRAQAIAKTLDGDAGGDSMLLVAAAYDRLGSTETGMSALRSLLVTPAAAPPAAEPAQLDLTDVAPISEIQAVEEVAPIEELVEVAEVATPKAASAPAPAPAPEKSASASGTWKAPLKSEIDEGEFKDPAAGVKFPSHRSRRR